MTRIVGKIKSPMFLPMLLMKIVLTDGHFLQCLQSYIFFNTAIIGSVVNDSINIDRS